MNVQKDARIGAGFAKPKPEEANLPHPSGHIDQPNYKAHETIQYVQVCKGILQGDQC